MADNDITFDGIYLINELPPGIAALGISRIKGTNSVMISIVDDASPTSPSASIIINILGMIELLTAATNVLSDIDANPEPPRS